MKQMIIKRGWLAVALCVAGTFPAQAQSAGSRDEASIKAQLTAYAEASQQGDGHARALFYTEDAEVWLSTTRTLSRGRAAIAKELDRPRDPNRRFRLEIENISILSADVALVDAQYYDSSPEPSGHAFYVMVKQDAKWLIRATRTTRFVPASR
jgi:ketosteroid isomerase-like protein